MSVAQRNDLVEEVFGYLGPVVRDGGFDIILGQEKRGYALALDSFSAHPSELAGRSLLPLRSVQGRGMNLHGKKILAFDDIVRTGGTVNRMQTKVAEAGFKAEIAILARLESVDAPTLPPKYICKTERELNNVRDRITEYLVNDRLFPIDYHHIYVRGIPKPVLTFDELRASLSELGNLYPKSPSDNEHVLKVGIQDPSFASWKSFSLPSNITDFSSWKIRIRAKGNEICIFPEVVPEVIPFTGLPAHSVQWCFCDKYGRSGEGAEFHGVDERAQTLMYSQCIIFNASLSLLEAFLVAWKAKLRHADRMFDVAQILYEDAEFVYGDPGITEHIRARVTNALS